MIQPPGLQVAVEGGASRAICHQCPPPASTARAHCARAALLLRQEEARRQSPRLKSSLLPQEQHLQPLRRRVTPEEDLSTPSSSFRHCPKRTGHRGSHTHAPTRSSPQAPGSKHNFQGHLHSLPDVGKSCREAWSSLLHCSHVSALHRHAGVQQGQGLAW